MWGRNNKITALRRRRNEGKNHKKVAIIRGWQIQGHGDKHEVDNQDKQSQGEGDYDEPVGKTLQGRLR